MPQPEKIKKVDEIAESLKQAKGVFLTDFSGLSVEEITQLRREFRKADVSYVVVKNTLAKRSCQQVGLNSMLQYLNGPTGLALAHVDPVAPVRVIVDFLKMHKAKGKPEIKGAVVEGQMLTAEEAEAMKNIPPRHVLIAQVVGGIAAPLTGLVGGLQGVIRNLVYTLDAIRDKKES
ncbi:50S ribosomal protein L10 [candidate division KSB1 bacterium]|nr:50S ribosomal protein L10 [candidate division KSB1 bacterium]RQW05334.1 MAG: 50S ribosomal protein L10 [candidate division KSB1 bacterium]